jgi:hypothetical protein
MAITKSISSKANVRSTTSADITMLGGGGTGGLTSLEVIADTAMNVNFSYVANKPSGGALKFTLPATSKVGDRVEIAGLSSQGFTIYSNATATTQFISYGSSGSLPSSSSSIMLANSTAQYATILLECVVANSQWTVLNLYDINLINNYFGTGADGNVTYSVNTSLTSALDGDMVVMNYNNLTIDNNITLTTSNRCKGMLLYVKGNLTVGSNSFITMTARGPSINPASISPPVNVGGIIIRRAKNGGAGTDSTADQFQGCGAAALASENSQPSVTGGLVITIPRVGAAGGTPSGNVGGNGALTYSPGGGGSGAESGGNGGAATCFSGGAGSGGASGGGSGAGSSFGGAGSNANAANLYSAGGGGAGNPGGSGDGNGTGAGPSGGTGTGGLLIIIVGGNVIIGSGSALSANGTQGGQGGTGGSVVRSGGGSGGGLVVLLYRGSYSTSGSITANGGVSNPANFPGGAGGAGYVLATSIL